MKELYEPTQEALVASSLVVADPVGVVEVLLDEGQRSLWVSINGIHVLSLSGVGYLTVSEVSRKEAFRKWRRPRKVKRDKLSIPQLLKDGGKHDL